ncbi:hypothetical protein EDB86DRAFT_2962234 [Lactarius hatsudake]|nr:hypothetical protein EDB86DRAFT_2962234 [Lactarius hatsudake]
MTISSAQKTAIEDIVDALKNATSPKKKRGLSELFLELVDKATWANYYEVIPQPRCLNGVLRSLQAGSYKEPLEAYEDLSLVFLNALYYNEPTSQIYKDAETLKTTLENEWKLRTVLPVSTRTSPPPTSAQKVHGQLANQQQKTETQVARPPPVTLGVPIKSVGHQAPTQNGTPSAPAVDSPPPPQASTSNQPSSPPRMSSPDMDVDVGGTPEPESMGVDDMARDGESDLVVQQLDRGLPRWEGLSDAGWMKEKEGSEDRWLELVLAIKGHKDTVGNRYATAIEAMPEETNIPYLSFNFPLSLKLVESRARAKTYASNKAFDKEVAQLFEKARRWHEPGSDRIWASPVQALTSPSPPSGPPYVSSTNFASLRAGPGSARPLHTTSDSEKLPAVTTFRVSSKDRTFVDEGDISWMERQACRLAAFEARKGQPGVTACHFADHPVEDIIAGIACQFTARHIRGRPRPPSWYLGWPLYVCDSRYNDRGSASFEVRKSADFMPIYPFERMVFPTSLRPVLSLRVRAIRGPGGIGESIDRAEGERIEGGGTGRKRTRKAGAPTDISGPSKGLYVGVGPASVPGATPQATVYSPQPASVQPRTEDRSIVTAAGGAAVLGNNANMEKLSAETARHFDRDPETNEVLWFAAPPLNIARKPAPRHSLQYLHWLATKRKAIEEDRNGAEGMNVDTNEERVKRTRSWAVNTTATERVDRFLMESGQD